MKVVHMRCAKCGSQHAFQNQPMEVCREKVCERCGVTLYVVSSEGQIDPPPTPDRERVKQSKELMKKEADTAQRILVEAFGTGKE